MKYNFYVYKKESFLRFEEKTRHVDLLDEQLRKLHVSTEALVLEIL